MTARRRDEDRVTEDHPEAGASEDHVTLTEEAAYGEVHPDATAETYAEQTERRGRRPGKADARARDREAEDEDATRGSALPSEEGHRS